METREDALMQEVQRYYSENFEYITSEQPTLSILTNIARHFAEWQKEQMMKDAVVLNGTIDELSCGYYNLCVEKGLTSEDDVEIIVVKK